VRPRGAPLASTTIEAVRDGRCIALRVYGELDLATAPVLRARILEVVRQHPARMEIDLRGVTFLDVVTVGVLEQTRTAACAHGIAFEIRNAAAPARRILELAGSHLIVADELEPDPDAGDGETATRTRSVLDATLSVRRTGRGPDLPGAAIVERQEPDDAP
jgi:anti-anti-sigma factor